jgi:hypothetical protein
VTTFRWWNTLFYAVLSVILAIAIGIYWVRAHSLEFRTLPLLVTTELHSSVRPPDPRSPFARFWQSNPNVPEPYDIRRAWHRGRWSLATQEDVDLGRDKPYTVRGFTPIEMHRILLHDVYGGTVVDTLLWPILWIIGSSTLLIGVGIALDIRRRFRLLSYEGIQTWGRRTVRPEKLTSGRRKTDFVFATEEPIKEE